MYITHDLPQHSGVTPRRMHWFVACNVAVAVQLAHADAPRTAEPRVTSPRLDAPADVPLGNRPNQASPPARPGAADAEAKARILFEAIVRDDPQHAASVFFPKDAFLLVKDMRDPGRYFDRLQRRFESDVHVLHRRLQDPTTAEFVRFDLAKRGGFVREREEGNRLPYWAARHSFLHFRDRGKLQHFEVRVLITWDDRWFVIHLNEFR